MLMSHNIYIQIIHKDDRHAYKNLLNMQEVTSWYTMCVK